MPSAAEAMAVAAAKRWNIIDLPDAARQEFGRGGLGAASYVPVPYAPSASAVKRMGGSAPFPLVGSKKSIQSLSCTQRVNRFRMMRYTRKSMFLAFLRFLSSLVRGYGFSLDFSS